MSDYIPITFDKSHLTTIGTRLCAERLDLVRELVANPQDARKAFDWQSRLLTDALTQPLPARGKTNNSFKQELICKNF